MAFWGIEVKAGKPYVHQFDSERGTLHISQATLGTYSSKMTTKRIIVQCNVGEKMPIYLCSLLPEKNETCPLNLEFEEDNEVTFSVIGPHSVHLSGYFYGENQDTCGHDYGSDSYEEDIAETESEGEESTDYDTDDDVAEFIDHDIDMFPPSPVPNSGVRIEEIIDDEKPANENGSSQRPKKTKNKLSGSDGNDNSQRQIVVKSGTGVPVMESEDEDGFPITSADKRKSNFPNTEEKAEVKDKGIDEGAKKKKEKDDTVSSKTVKRKIHGDADQLSDRETNDKQARKNKKKKVRGKEEKVNEYGTGSNDGIKPEEATTVHVDQAVAVEKKSEEELTSEKVKKKKNKKKNKKQDSAADVNLKQNLSDKNGSSMEIEEKAEAKPVQERSFPNGLVIEELGMGKPDGKRASPGKKVGVHYIGKLKKNGKIFDSNIGRAPFKFRLGVGQVIKGWDVGVRGMRVGDKRRLTIPPAMGYGTKGAAGAIPPNSWLVFDVELVDAS